jgi:hypothetical protein
MAEGTGFTVNAHVEKLTQPNPLVTVYVIVAVPAATPVTTPPVPMLATDVLLLLHTPDGVGSVRVVVPPTHTLDAPLIPATTGSAFTVTVVVVVQPVGSV